MTTDSSRYEQMASSFLVPGVKAIALMGSCARGDAGAFSDVDLVRFTAGEDAIAGSGTHLIDGRFVVVSDVTPSAVGACFTDPEMATTYMMGLRTALSLWDPDRYFAGIQERAECFLWDDVMQDKANIYAGTEMVGWIEEAQKGLEGLRRGDEGRMLNAKHGLTWGLTRVVRVYKGILISSDNASYTQVTQNLGVDSRWTMLSRKAFGLEPDLSLTEQVRAGLELYLLTYEMIEDGLHPDDQRMISEAVSRIRAELMS